MKYRISPYDIVKFSKQLEALLFVTEKEIPFVKSKLTKKGYAGVIMLRNFPVLGWGEYTITVAPVGYEASVHKTQLIVDRFEPPRAAVKKKENWLDLQDFESVEHAQELATHWEWIYNYERPNTAIGGVPPRHYAIIIICLLRGELR